MPARGHDSGESGPAPPLRLLVVDDNEDDAVLVCRELERCGYAVSAERVETRSGMAEALAREPWDLIISDFGMPTFSGPEALALYREWRLDIPFIIVSGTISEDQAVESLKAGADDFISKGKVARLGPAVSRALRDAEERTARRRVERAHAKAVEQLRESEARYRQLVESIQDVIFAGQVDPADPAAHRLVLVSPQVETLTGLAAEAFVDDPLLWSTLIHPEDHVAVHEAAVEAFARRASVRRRYRIWNRKRKEHRWIEDVFTPEVNGSGRVIGFFGVARDVTEQRRIEEKLSQAQKMEAVGQLAGGIAHDFNNLLGIIMGCSELMLRQLEVDHPAYRRAREIQGVVERAAALPRQLLAFTRKQSLEQTIVNLNVVVTETEGMLRRVIGEDIRLSTILGGATGCISADGGQISQVIVNLVINARDAMPQGGDLTLETSSLDLGPDDPRWPGAPPGPYALLAIRDTGVGMDEATRARMFEPFFTTKQPGKGTGLGLASVQSIVALHGAHLAVESAPGVGTTFRIVFPRANAEAPASPWPRSGSALSGGTERILLLEDEATLRVVVRELLEVAGYTVTEADIPEAALEAAEKSGGAIDLLITDLVMPRMGGREVADAVLAMHPRMKVLFVSGYSGERMQDEAPDRAADFLQKPFSADALLAKIREVLAGG
jgi:two-component system, cell cycle sensor histidine kinase and response regulator CckA